MSGAKYDEISRRDLLRARMEGADFVPSNSLTSPGSSHTFGESAHSSIPPGVNVENSWGRPPSISVDQSLTRSIEYNVEINRLKSALDTATKENTQYKEKNEKLSEFIKTLVGKVSTLEEEKRESVIADMCKSYGFLLDSHIDQKGSDKWSDTVKVKKLQTELEILKGRVDEARQRGGYLDLVKRLELKIESINKELKTIQDNRKEILRALKYHASEYKPGDLLDEGNIILLDMIGKGGFAEVWKAYDFRLTSIVAVKIQSQNMNWDPDTIHNFARHIAREISIMGGTSHPNVVTYYRFFYHGDNCVVLVMEYCEGGDLLQAITAKNFDEKTAHKIIVQVIEGLSQLMKRENSDEIVIHYDLKPANILLDNWMTPKITDFGLSKIAESGQPILLTSMRTGTPGYTDPTTFKGTGRKMITSSVDTWSIGVIYYEMITGDFKFKHEIQNPSIKIAVTAKRISEEGRKFIEMCLDRNPDTRPTIQMLRTNPYLTAPPSKSKTKKEK